MPTGAFLVDAQFRELNENGAAVVRPFDDQAIQPASVDLRLGNVEYVYSIESHTLGEDLPDGAVEERAFVSRLLNPGEAAFIALQSEMHIPADCLGFVFPRSSVTRLGLAIPPVFMNPGYSGQMPLTITNNSTFPITLLPGVRVAQLVCAKLDATPLATYGSAIGSKYAGERHLSSLLHTDTEIQRALDQVLRESVPSKLLMEA